MVTEAEILSGKVTILLGSKSHALKVLPIAKADTWIESLDDLDTAKDEAKKNSKARNEYIAKLCEVVCAYAPESLVENEVMNSATGVQLQVALDRLKRATDPFVLMAEKDEAKTQEQIQMMMEMGPDLAKLLITNGLNLSATSPADDSME